MVQQACSSEYVYEGSSALDVSRPRLTLLEGGASSSPARSVAVTAHPTHARPSAPDVPMARTRTRAASSAVASAAAPRMRVRLATAAASPTARPALVLSHRLAAGFLIASLVICLSVTLGVDAFRSQGVATATSSLSTTQIVVSQGDSLWSLARSHPIDGLSDQETVHWLESENSLSSGSLTVGQELSVAAR